MGELMNQIQKVKQVAREIARENIVSLKNFKMLRDWDDSLTPEWYAEQLRGEGGCLIWKTDENDEFLKGKPKESRSTHMIANRFIYEIMPLGDGVMKNIWIIKLWLY